MYRMLVKVFHSIRAKYELAKYNDFTIGEYFRKQGAIIGKENRILVRSLGTEPFLVEIGDHCLITANVAFATHDGATWLFTDEEPGLQKFGKISIRDNCFIGYNALIMPNVIIGPNSIVGAGAVVTKDVPPKTVVGGNPAKIICTLEEYKIKVIRRWLTQKPPGYMAELKSGVMYKPEYVDNLKRRDFHLLKDHLTRLARTEMIKN